jgi:hypothetical protein
MGKKKGSKKKGNGEEGDKPKPPPKPPPGFTEEEWVLYNNPDIVDLTQHLRGPCAKSTLPKFIISQVHLYSAGPLNCIQL